MGLVFGQASALLAFSKVVCSEQPCGEVQTGTGTSVGLTAEKCLRSSRERHLTNWKYLS
jgi:hypothetical protein